MDRRLRNLRLDLAYEGTRYHGFGVQPGRLTVQEVLEDALTTALGERVRVTPAGRTDAGVHASGQVVGLRTSNGLTPRQLVRAANALLPEDVQVQRATEAPPGFDARRSALRRHYRYTVWNGPLPNLWQRRLSWHVGGRLDDGAMNEAAGLLAGRRDFASFEGQAVRESPMHATVRTVEHARWRRDQEWLWFDIVADAFLRHMVRALVGTLVMVGTGRLSVDEFRDIVQAADRRRAGRNAPPEGLMLIRVDYPDQFNMEAAGSASSLQPVCA